MRARAWVWSSRALSRLSSVTSLKVEMTWIARPLASNCGTAVTDSQA